MATTTAFVRTVFAIVALSLAAVQTAPTSSSPRDSSHVARSACYQIHVTTLPGSNSSVMLKGVGLVRKYLVQAVELMDEYLVKVRSDRLYNKQVPRETQMCKLPSTLVETEANLVALFHRLAVSCLLFEELAKQELQDSWRTKLALIKDELVESLCHTHILLHLTGNYLSHSTLANVTKWFHESLTLPMVPHEDREWRHLRDYEIASAVHRVSRRSIRELKKVETSVRDWLKSKS